MKITFIIISIFLSIVGLQSQSQTVKILFDATKAETAGNADWVIDANNHDLGFFNGPAVLGSGDESDPQQIPSPAQSGINATTNEGYWNGALSYWGIDCVRKNYHVETLPFNGHITYGNTGNAQDLSYYNVFIVCEPNIVFTAAEKTAIINFVQNGGGLFMISDHDNSDRNGDGWDSPHIWDDLINNNSIHANPFGIVFDYVDISQTSTNVASLPGDSILNGTAGNVTEVQWSNGTTMTLDPIQDPTVKGVIFKNGSAHGNSNVMCAYSRYGNGKVAAIGDSSPCDDGTGDVNDQLYDGYIADANGNHRKLLMNITIWLASSNSTTQIDAPAALSNIGFNVYPNPVSTNSFDVNYTLTEKTSVTIKLFDATGRLIQSVSHDSNFPGQYFETIDIEDLKEGIYYCILSTDYSKVSKPIIVLR